MNVHIIAVGKVKEKYLREGIKEYEKRLLPYCKINTTEVMEEEAPAKATAAFKEALLKKEGERILRALKPHSYKIVLAVEGERHTSESMASKMEKLMLMGVSDFTFIIGGSFGLHSEVKKTADLVLSFSDFTFPHQMMRLILLEQIYRCMKIIKKEPYHR